MIIENINNIIFKIQWHKTYFYLEKENSCSNVIWQKLQSLVGVYNFKIIHKTGWSLVVILQLIRLIKTNNIFPCQ